MIAYRANNLSTGKVHIKDFPPASINPLTCEVIWKGKTISLEVEPSQTIFHVKQQLQRLESIPIEHLMLIDESRYLSDQQTLEFCKNKRFQGPLRMIDGRDPFQIFYRHVGGRYCVIEVRTSDTAQQVVDLIKTKERSPLENFIFRHGTTNLDGFVDPSLRTVFDLNIVPDATITLSYRMVGGGTLPLDFSDLESAKTIRIPSKPSVWEVHKRGLNLIGKCGNQNCEASKEGEVVVPLGYGTFNLNEYCCEAKCPNCQQLLEDTSVNSCSFYQCIYSVEGRRKATSEEEKSGLKFVEVKKEDLKVFRKHHALTFSTETKSLSQWYYLNITTHELPSKCTLL
jgi:hypothetical protein